STVRELADVRLHVERAGRALERLSESGGVSGFSQRSEKFNFQNAQVAPAASAPAFGGASLPAIAASSAAGGRGAVAGMPGGQRGGQGGNAYRAIASDQGVIAEGVQNAGKEKLSTRGKQWIANRAKAIDLEKDKAQIQEIKRFSDEYFALVRANTPDENAVLAAQQEGEELLVRFRGQAYLVK